MTITSVRQTAPFQTVANAPEPLLIRRPRAAALEAVPPVPRESAAGESRASGDSELAVLVANALLQVNGNPGHDEAIMLDGIPAHSTFGQWWSQLGRSMQSQQVVDWMRSLGINRESLQIAPDSGRITYSLRPVAPVAPGQENPLDDKGWSRVGGSVQEAAHVVGGGSSTRFKPPLSENSNQAPLWLVNHFYREREHILPAHAHDRAEELARDKAFPTLHEARHPGLSLARSEDELERQKTTLGNLQTHYNLANELSYLADQQTEGRFWYQQIPQYLERNPADIHPDSVYAQELGPGAGTSRSLKAFIDDNGWDVPTDQAQLENLKSALVRPPLKAPVHGNYGGALAWPTPLDETSQRRLRANLRHGTVGGIDLSHSRNVLEYLMQNASVDPLEIQRSPQRVLEQLIRSPKGQALGKAIQAMFDARNVKGSANDWLLAALSVQQKDSAGATGVRSREWIAGFELMGKDSWGKPAVRIVTDLALHLLNTGESSSPPNAMLRAHLLLATRAPEFVVKDIPDAVRPGSHSWVSFVTAVERIEAQVPGATANMTYGQVMVHADIAPISAQERQVEYAAQREALRFWAVANEMPSPSTDEQMDTVRKAFDAQINDLKDASAAFSAPMPERQHLALEQLKTVLPNMTPEQLKDPCITLAPSHSQFPGPYSVLELYMDGNLFNRPSVERHGPIEGVFLSAPPTENRWVSSSNGVDISDVLAKTQALPNISNEFQRAFLTYSNNLEKAIGTYIEHMIRQLPASDREPFKFAKFTLAKEVQVARLSADPEPRRRVKENALLIKTERAGHPAKTYEIDLKKGQILERPDRRDLTPEPRFNDRPLSDQPNSRLDFEKVTPTGDYPTDLTEEQSEDAPISGRFSERTAYIAKAMVEDANVQALKSQAQGVTTFDTEVPFTRKAKEFLLNLIPLRSAIKNFQDGNVGSGIADLFFDALGFAVGVGSAAKGAKALQAGASALGKFAHGAKIVGRAAMGSLNPLSGVDDLARLAYGAGAKGIHKLRGALTQVDLTALAKKTGVAQGTIKASNTADSVREIAKFDDATGHWHALDLKTKQPYGTPLKHFSADAVPVDKLRNDLQKLHDKLGDTGSICYEKAMFVGQADNALPRNTRNAVLNSLDTSTTNTSNYTPRYKELMGVSPATTKSTFNPADITESGVINFVSRNENGRMVHTAYIQRASDNKLYLYSTNQVELDLAMYKSTGKLDTSAGALVSSLDNDGLQHFLDKGYDFIFTPNSTLNSNVKRLAA